MDTIAPDVSDSAWGHKYFSILYPDKLDSYHNFEHQCFHLIKLLQQLPSDVRRYTLAQHYVTLSDNLQIPLNHLTTLLNERNGSPYTYWRVGTNAGGGKPGEYWPMMREGQLCAIGWAKLGDLTTIVNSKEGKEKIRYALQNKYPDMLAPVVGRCAQQIFSFIHSIALGDIILASEGAKVLGIGKVTGPYTYDASADFPHQRSVEWLSLEQWKQPDTEGLLTTVWKMRNEQNFVEAERQVLDAINETTGNTGPIPPSLTGIPSRIQTALERKGQVILYGPPGTGKTYWAEDAACELAARSRFNLSFGQLSVEQKALINGKGNTTNGNVRLCSFHPAYGYEDFLEGFRPTSQNGNMQFVPREGIFKKLCGDAQKAPNQKFYLIIDEINRGDIPRIFGELLTVIEMDKRGKPIVLPLTGQSFSVPKNVYVIGTMNTADRSIALLDTALRRRFGFIELMPDTTPLNMAMARGIPLGPWLEDLNRRICESIGQDARNRQIGHAYFLQNGQPISDFTLFARVIQEDIIPLLEEYCYEDYTKLASILGKQLVDSQNQKIRHELFDTSRQDKLLDALLEPCSIITTSIVAANAEIAKKLLEQDNQTIDQEIAGASSSEVVESHS